MKSKIFSGILILFAAFSCFSFSKKHYEESVEGIVICCGSEPAVFPVLEADDGRLFSFKADKKVKVKLLVLQAKKMMFYGSIEEKCENVIEKQKDGVFVLKDFEEIK